MNLQEKCSKELFRRISIIVGGRIVNPMIFRLKSGLRKYLTLIYSAKSLSGFKRLEKYLTVWSWKKDEHKKWASLHDESILERNSEIHQIALASQQSQQASSKMIFPSYISIHRVVLLSDPWPILSFTFSHNRLLMDFRRQEKWILRDLLMMLSSTNIQFI